MTLSEAERKKRPCAACGEPVGTATIVCGGEYPDAPLCLRCGNEVPLEDVYARIRARQCAAVENCVDGSENSQCQREKGHPPPHHCLHGFHWTDEPEDFTGRCGYCGSDVKLRKVAAR